jgi:Ser/Thr protein kinase RdoA (MazF antagonist)
VNVSPDVRGALEDALGAPVELNTLKHKPQRRLTLRATGSASSGIVKLYASDRAAMVARRVAALAAGPAEPRIPQVIACMPELHMVVFRVLPGRPLREALLDGDRTMCGKAGMALGRWHAFWSGRAPSEFGRHTLQRELHILSRAAERAPGIGELVAPLMHSVATREPWSCTTVVHRDLYEEHVIVSATTGLIDLDDAACGPPELDLGNLLAHIDLLQIRSGANLGPAVGALVSRYGDEGPRIDLELLSVCRRLSLLRLACIHGERRLLAFAREVDVAPRRPRGRPRLEEALE